MRRQPMKFFLALLITKIIAKILKIFSPKTKSSKPGEIALRICPSFLKHFILPKEVIAVTGTNGKTSVANLINDILKDDNYRTIINDSVENSNQNIAHTLINKANFKGEVKADIIILKVEPHLSKNIYQYITPSYLICTALFRNPNQEKGHVEAAFKKMQQAILKDTTLILNADDLISCFLGPKNKKIFFSVKNVLKKTTNNIVQDIQTCPNCHALLKFKHRHHHHIGQVECKKCNFSNFKPDFVCTKKDKTLTIKEKQNTNQYPITPETIYDIYNVTAVISLLRTLGLKPTAIKHGLEKSTLNETYKTNYKNKEMELISILAKNKNPISTSLAFDYISNLDGNKAIILMISDSLEKLQGSENISWLYDTDFEFLKKRNIKQIIVCGNRAYDLNIRLQIAGIKNDIIFLNDNYQNIYELINFKKINKLCIAYETNSYRYANNLIKKIVGELND